MLPEGGRHRLVGHLDDLVEGRASELHVQVDGLDHVARGERPGGRVLRRGARADEGLRAHHQTRLLRHLPRYRREVRRSRSTTGQRRRSSASTAAATTARPTTSGSTSGSRSRADARRRHAPTGAAESRRYRWAARISLAFLLSAADGLAGGGVPGFACGAAGFGVLDARTPSPARWCTPSPPTTSSGWLTDAVFRTATVRTVSVALLVTVLCVRARGAAGVLHGQGRLARGCGWRWSSR